MPEEVVYTMTNLDGIEAQVQRYRAERIAFLSEQGYSRVVALRGELGASELGFHTGTAYKIGITAFLRENTDHYAYVLLADGSLIDGCFCLFSDGRFSLS